MKQLHKRFSALVCLLLAAAVLAGCSGGSAVSSGSSASSEAASSEAASSDASSVPEAEAYDYSAGLTDEGYWEGVDALSLVTLGEYKGVELPESVTTADPATIDQQLESIRQSYSTGYEEITDRAVEDGDTVNIDYVGSVDGVEFTGGNTSGAGTEVTIGVTQYIDDFLEQLIGHKPGETFDVNVTFPDGYNDSTDAEGNTLVLANQDAVFVVTINYIQGEAILPELNDAFVAENLEAQFGFTTVAELRAELEASLIEEQELSFWSQWLLDNCTVSEVPESMIQYWKDGTIAELNATASAYGMDASMLLSMQGFESEEAYLESIHESVTESCKQRLAVQAIAQTEGITVTEEDEIEALGEENHAEALEYYGQGYVRMTLLVDKVFERLGELAVRA